MKKTLIALSALALFALGCPKQCDDEPSQAVADAGKAEASAPEAVADAGAGEPEAKADAGEAAAEGEAAKPGKADAEKPESAKGKKGE